jgi:photosystem II stability/assembly factor-like uncharacterized protein
MQALLGTRKGLFILKKNGADWKVAKTHFAGVKVSYACYEPQSKLIWAGVNHGHWGPKLHVSADKGKTFKEVGAPKFPEATKETLKDFWSLAADSKGRVYLGVEPAALFYSDDQGKSWSLCEGLSNVHSKDKWFSGGTDASCLHSLIVDPKNDNHIIIGISVAGCLETKDRGKNWKYINKGLNAEFLPEKDSEVGQDPHMVIAAPSDANILWQQNHCGIFKSEDMGQTWKDLSKAKGVKTAFGWGIVADEKNPQIAYTVPAQSDETRLPLNKRLIVQMTKDGGKSWKVLNKGLPKNDSYDIVYRHGLSLKDKSLMFGSTTGHLYFSNNKGDSWKKFSTDLPPIFSVKLI